MTCAFVEFLVVVIGCTLSTNRLNSVLRCTRTVPEQSYDNSASLIQVVDYNGIGHLLAFNSRLDEDQWKQNMMPRVFSAGVRQRYDCMTWSDAVTFSKTGDGSELRQS